MALVLVRKQVKIHKPLEPQVLTQYFLQSHLLVAVLVQVVLVTLAVAVVLVVAEVLDKQQQVVLKQQAQFKAMTVALL